MSGILAIMGSKKAATLSVYFTAGYAYVYQYSPTDATSSFQIGSTGIVYSTGETDYTWLLSGLNSDYEVKAELNASSPYALSSGTLSAWLLLNTNPVWTRSATTNAAHIRTSIIDLQVRRVSDSAVLAEFIVTIEAEVV